MENNVNRPVHSHLDGDLDFAALTAEEEIELRAMEEAIELATARLRLAPVPDLRSRVMDAIPAAPARPRAVTLLAEVTRWLWAPWQVTVRPAYLFAGAMAAMLLLAVVPAQRATESFIPPMAAERDAGQLYVQFRLEATGASNVALAGSFTDWQPSHELREVAPGTWAALVALEPGVHDYLFVVDGQEWVADPVASPVEDGFGGTNSRLFLVAPTNRT
jgi:hypothetical protein